MMRPLKETPRIKIKIAETEDFFDLNLCAKEFIDFIDNFKKKFLDKKFFVLVAYFKKVLAGVLIAEDRAHKIDSLENILPKMYIHLLYVNPKYRGKGLGKDLLHVFLDVQKKRGVAAVSIKLPQKYKKGIKFFKHFDFTQISRDVNKVVLELKLWNDFGLTDCQSIDEDLFLNEA